MANSLEYVNRTVPIEQLDKAVKFTVEVKFNDSGLITINGAPMGGMGPPKFATPELAVAASLRFLCQVFEEALKESNRRTQQHSHHAA